VRVSGVPVRIEVQKDLGDLRAPEESVKLTEH